jgi:predicted O-methyltransferase YrrM
VGADPQLEAALSASAAAGLPAINVSPPQGKFLQLLAQIHHARSILEIGTLGGYSTIWLARALPPGGKLISLELNEHHAEVARANIARAGLGGVVEIMVGNALTTLGRLEEKFDLIFVDADKSSNADYLTWALRLARPGGVIVVDNVVLEGWVADASSDSAAVRGTRAMLEMIRGNPRLSATVIQTVGSKGYDGMLLARVSGPAQ